MSTRLFRSSTRSRSEAGIRGSKIFSEREFLTLTSYLDTLLPESALGPSASAAGVPKYIESLCEAEKKTRWNLFRRRKVNNRSALLAFFRHLIARLDSLADEELGRPFFLLTRPEQRDLIAEFANTSERDVLADDVSLLLPEELADCDLYRLSRVYAIQGYFSLPKPEAFRSLRTGSEESLPAIAHASR